MKPMVKKLLPLIIVLLLTLQLAAPAGAIIGPRLGPLSGKLDIIYPAEGTVVYSSNLGLMGVAPDSSAVKVSLRDSSGNIYFEGDVPVQERIDQRLKIGSQSYFSTDLVLQPGLSVLKVSTQDNTAEKILHIIYDDAPLISDLQPLNNTRFVNTNEAVISGRVENCDLLLIGRTGENFPGRVSLNADGTFNYTVNLKGGNNDFEIVAIGGSPSSTVRKLRLIYDNGQPLVVFNSPVEGSTVFQDMPAIKGYVLNGSSLKLSGREVPLKDTDGDGFVDFTCYPLSALTPGGNTLNFEVSQGGSAQSYQLNLTYEPLPILDIYAPHDGAAYGRTISLFGQIQNATSLQVSQENDGAYIIQNSNVTWDEEGYFSKEMVLAHGVNTITVTATNSKGKISEKITVNYEGRPTITVEEPLNDSAVYKAGLTVKGAVSGARKLTINGRETSFDSQGKFSAAITLEPGYNYIYLEAMDGAVSTSKRIAVFFEDNPMIEVDKPLDQETVDATAVLVKGRIYNADSGGVSYENKDPQGGVTSKGIIRPASDGTFSVVVRLKEGANTITLKAAKGNYTASHTLTVVSNGQPDLTLLEPFDGEVVYSNTITVRGNVKTGDEAQVKVNGVLVSLDTDGTFSHEYTLRPGTNTITVIAAQDKKSAKKTLKVLFSQLVKPGAYREAAVPANGGNTSFFEGQVIINFPKGAFREDQKLGVRILEPGDYPAPPSRELAGPVIRLTLPDKPLKTTSLSIAFSEITRKALYNNIALCYYNQATGTWEPVGGKIDSKKGQVQAFIDRSGIYAPLVYYNSFDDIFNHWARNDIEPLVARGIVKGISPTTFAPEQRITRAEFAVMLVRALGVPLAAPGNATFTDVPKSHWAYQHVETAIRHGLVQGTSASRFSPEAVINREQAAVMLARSANLPSLKEDQWTSQLAAYKDSGKISLYARQSVAQAVKNKLLAGTTGETFSPRDLTTRAQAARMVAGLLKFTKRI